MTKDWAQKVGLNMLSPTQGFLVLSIPSTATLSRGPNPQRPKTQEISGMFLPHTGFCLLLFPELKK